MAENMWEKYRGERETKKSRAPKPRASPTTREADNTVTAPQMWGL